MKWLTIPNLLSFSRLPLAAAFLLFDSVTARIVIVCAVALTDLLDGFVARRIRSHDRRAGELVDPITDKLFVLIGLVTFVVKRELSLGALLLLLVRDIYNSIGFAWLKLRRSRVVLRARPAGKTATVLQLAVLLALLFLPRLVKPLIWATVIVSLIAIVDYTRAALRQRPLAADASTT